MWINLIIAGAVAGLIAVQFYLQYWELLRTYYSIHASLVTVHWTLQGAKPFILNIPGFMYWRSENSIVCVALTFASHLFVLLMLPRPCGPVGSSANRLICFPPTRHRRRGDLFRHLSRRYEIFRQPRTRFSASTKRCWCGGLC